MKEANLVCAKGHAHYSPTPDAFVGKRCLRAIGSSGFGSKCQLPLKRVKEEK